MSSLFTKYDIMDAMPGAGLGQYDWDKMPKDERLKIVQGLPRYTPDELDELVGEDSAQIIDNCPEEWESIVEHAKSTFNFIPVNLGK